MKKKYEAGSHHLHRKPFFNEVNQLDVDIPDGDIEVGKRVFKKHCSSYYMINISCHALFQVHKTGPKLHNIFGKKAGQQKGFLKYYSPGNRNFGHQWSKQRLFCLITNPQEVLGLQSNMLFGGLPDPYQKACVIQYLHYLRIHTSKIKPQWINEINE